MSKILHQYRNGNVSTTIYEDGTKVNEWEDDMEVEFPSSCDLKITQFCDLECEFCHEMSNKDGTHADLALIEKIWETQPAGTELAIGGGNPLSHPDLDRFLTTMSGRGIIPNLTVNTLHLKKYAEQLRNLQETKAIYGLGISYRGPQYMDRLPENISYKNAVFHLIAGINDLSDCDVVIEWCRKRNISPKILLLGYKQYGNGVKCYSEELQKKIDEWKNHLKKLMKYDGVTISFDNLAITQVDLQNNMSEDDWNSFYCGDDGSSTIYCDAVKEEVARTSTTPTRYPITWDDTVKTIFEKVRK